MWATTTRVIGNGATEALRMEAHRQAFDGDMGAAEGLVLGVGGSFLPAALTPLLKSKIFTRVPNMITGVIDANIGITGGVIGMNSLEIFHNLKEGVPVKDENGVPTGEIDYTYGAAIAEAFSGDEGFLLKQAKLYILTAGINLTKPKPLVEKWRRRLLRDIRGQYGKTYANLPPEVRKTYDDWDLGLDASSKELEAAYLKEAERLHYQGIKGEAEIKAFNDLTQKYKNAKKHQTEKGLIKDFLQESDKIEKQQDKNGKRYNKLDNKAKEIQEETFS